jgi:hypothetical protein
VEEEEDGKYIEGGIVEDVGVECLGCCKRPCGLGNAY